MAVGLHFRTQSTEVLQGAQRETDASRIGKREKIVLVAAQPGLVVERGTATLGE
jgi:hypothetical protein